MSRFIGSSHIKPKGPRGPQGPRGITGTTGPELATPGTTWSGPSGGTGAYITRIERYDDHLDFHISDENVFTVIGLTGNTGTYHLGAGSTVDAGQYDLFKGVDGGKTFEFTSIGGDGSLYVSVGLFNSVFITGGYNPEEFTGASVDVGMTGSHLLYLSEPDRVSELHGVTIDDEILFFNSILSKAQFPDEVDAAPAANVKLVTDTKDFTYTVGPILQDEITGVTGDDDLGGETSDSGILIDVDRGALVVINTPIGIKGFTGDFNAKPELRSFTAVVKGDGFWKFPDNVYFESLNKFFSCGTDICNFYSHDNGFSWRVVFAARGYNVDSCQSGGAYGSCCYQDPINETFKCKDYVTQSFCDNLYGVFDINNSCQNNCGITAGVCCSEGICLSEMSKAECDYYNATYWEGVTCNSYDSSPEGDNSIRFCNDPCQPQWACCKDGICIGNYSRIQCEEILEGTSINPNDPAYGGGTAGCGYIDCCDYIPYIGACCTEDTCLSDVTVQDCKRVGGVFMGQDVRCQDIDCCIVDDDEPVGKCCTCLQNCNSGDTDSEYKCEDFITQTNCVDGGGIFTPQTICTGEDDCPTVPPPDIGACCYLPDPANPDETACVNVTAEDCTRLGGLEFFPDEQCSEVDCDTDPPDPDPMVPCCMLCGYRDSELCEENPGLPGCCLAEERGIQRSSRGRAGQFDANTIPSCSADSDCGSAHICVNGVCRPSLYSKEFFERDPEALRNADLEDPDWETGGNSDGPCCCGGEAPSFCRSCNDDPLGTDCPPPPKANPCNPDGDEGSYYVACCINGNCQPVCDANHCEVCLGGEVRGTIPGGILEGPQFSCCRGGVGSCVPVWTKECCSADCGGGSPPCASSLTCDTGNCSCADAPDCTDGECGRIDSDCNRTGNPCGDALQCNLGWENPDDNCGICSLIQSGFVNEPTSRTECFYSTGTRGVPKSLCDQLGTPEAAQNDFGSVFTPVVENCSCYSEADKDRIISREVFAQIETNQTGSIVDNPCSEEVEFCSGRIGKLCTITDEDVYPCSDGYCCLGWDNCINVDDEGSCDDLGGIYTPVANGGPSTNDNACDFAVNASCIPGVPCIPEDQCPGDCFGNCTDEQPPDEWCAVENDNPDCGCDRAGASGLRQCTSLRPCCTYENGKLISCQRTFREVCDNINEQPEYTTVFHDEALYCDEINNCIPLGCGTEGAGSCYEANDTPYCELPGCCTAVCEKIPECCEVGWTQQCVNLAFQMAECSVGNCDVNGDDCNPGQICTCVLENNEYVCNCSDDDSDDCTSDIDCALSFPGQNLCCIGGECSPCEPQGCDPACTAPCLCVNGECFDPAGFLDCTPCDPPCVPPLWCYNGKCIDPEGEGEDKCVPPCEQPQICVEGKCQDPPDFIGSCCIWRPGPIDENGDFSDPYRDCIESTEEFCNNYDDTYGTPEFQGVETDCTMEGMCSDGCPECPEPECKKITVEEAEAGLCSEIGGTLPCLKNENGDYVVQGEYGEEACTPEEGQAPPPVLIEGSDYDPFSLSCGSTAELLCDLIDPPGGGGGPGGNCCEGNPCPPDTSCSGAPRCVCESDEDDDNGGGPGPGPSGLDECPEEEDGDPLQCSPVCTTQIMCGDDLSRQMWDNLGVCELCKRCRSKTRSKWLCTFSDNKGLARDGMCNQSQLPLQCDPGTGDPGQPTENGPMPKYKDESGGDCTADLAGIGACDGPDFNRDCLARSIADGMNARYEVIAAACSFIPQGLPEGCSDARDAFEAENGGPPPCEFAPLGKIRDAVDAALDALDAVKKCKDKPENDDGGCTPAPEQEEWCAPNCACMKELRNQGWEIGGDPEKSCPEGCPDGQVCCNGNCISGPDAANCENDACLRITTDKARELCAAFCANGEPCETNCLCPDANQGLCHTDCDVNAQEGANCNDGGDCADGLIHKMVCACRSQCDTRPGNNPAGSDPEFKEAFDGKVEDLDLCYTCRSCRFLSDDVIDMSLGKPPDPSGEVKPDNVYCGGGPTDDGRTRTTMKKNPNPDCQQPCDGDVGGGPVATEECCGEAQNPKEPVDPQTGESACSRQFGGSRCNGNPLDANGNPVDPTLDPSNGIGDSCDESTPCPGNLKCIDGTCQCDPENILQDAVLNQPFVPNNEKSEACGHIAEPIYKAQQRAKALLKSLLEAALLGVGNDGGCSELGPKIGGVGCYGCLCLSAITFDQRKQVVEEVLDIMFPETPPYKSLSPECKEAICTGHFNASGQSTRCANEDSAAGGCDDNEPLRNPLDILEELQECMMCPVMNTSDCDAEGYKDNLCLHRSDEGEWNQEGDHDPTNQDICYKNCVCGYSDGRDEVDNLTNNPGSDPDAPGDGFCDGLRCGNGCTYILGGDPRGYCMSGKVCNEIDRDAVTPGNSPGGPQCFWKPCKLESNGPPATPAIPSDPKRSQGLCSWCSPGPAGEGLLSSTEDPYGTGFDYTQLPDIIDPWEYYSTSYRVKIPVGGTSICTDVACGYDTTLGFDPCLEYERC